MSLCCSCSKIVLRPPLRQILSCFFQQRLSFCLFATPIFTIVCFGIGFPHVVFTGTNVALFHGTVHFKLRILLLALAPGKSKSIGFVASYLRPKCIGHVQASRTVDGTVNFLHRVHSTSHGKRRCFVIPGTIRNGFLFDPTRTINDGSIDSFPREPFRFHERYRRGSGQRVLFLWTVLTGCRHLLTQSNGHVRKRRNVGGTEPTTGHALRTTPQSLQIIVARCWDIFRPPNDPIQFSFRKGG